MPTVDVQLILAGPSPSERQAHPGSTLDVVLVVIGVVVVLGIMAIGYLRSRRK